MKKRQPLDLKRALNVQHSFQNIYLFAMLVEIEHQNEMDADFRNPNLHNIIKRIKQDATAIIQAAGAIIKNKDIEYTYSYVGELYRLNNLLIGRFNEEQLRSICDQIEKDFEEINIESQSND